MIIIVYIIFSILFVVVILVVCFLSMGCDLEEVVNDLGVIFW